tara:strand:+ start:2689 stop:3558 length:870 start_codon:yes stop_codon:yes gene_type:complete
LKNVICPSRITFGCEPLGGTDWGKVSFKKIEKAINKALDIGINSFDTAAVYGLGLSEKRLSKILGKKRHELFIATKGGLKWSEGTDKKRAEIVRDSSPKQLIFDIKASLKRLDLYSIPLFYIHWPDQKLDIEESIFTLKKLKLEGLIKNIGLSNYNLELLKSAQKVCKIDYIQIPWNIIEEPSIQLINFCINNNISIIVYNALSSGLLTGKFNYKSKFPANDRRSRLEIFRKKTTFDTIDKLSELAMSQKMTLTQFSIKKLWDNSKISSIIIGTKTEQQLTENCFLMKR